MLPALRSQDLPPLSFIDHHGNATALDLPRAAGRITALAARLRERFQPQDHVGLIYRSSPELVTAWLAALVAGLKPLIMQYPTRKQTRDYWDSSIGNTIAVAGLSGIVCDAAVAPSLAGAAVSTMTIDFADLGEAEPSFEIERFSIIQLSSGTTGFRKAVEFTSEALTRHALDYNATLQLGPGDTIVSWLPLYHDMGYVACFVMPLLAGIPVVMMDPEVWVTDRGLLYRAIAEHRGTVCFMPNFGFEVMSHLPPGDLSSMRLWISCSEPVSAETARRFLRQTGQPETHFAACYAMAENIFAVSQRSGIATRRIGEADVISCGQPIAGVEIKIVEDEIWVRSPTSLQAYLGGQDLRDDDGFYPTGDRGALVDGELYVTGRKRDLLIQAGKKFMLSDIDLAVNAVLPDARGRVAALSDFDERLGTHKPVVLIEAKDFFTRADHARVGKAIRSATGLDHVEVHFVPPRFLTKTSSGKINRPVSLKNWQSVQQARQTSGERRLDLHGELQSVFGKFPQNLPVREVLDSLSTTVLRIILAEAGIPHDGNRSLGSYAEALETRPKDEGEGRVIRIVSLADKRAFSRFSMADLEDLSRRLGAPIHFEHLCLPPSPLLLSDLIHYDYFRPRADGDAYAAVGQAVAKLRNASLILTDDVAEFYFAPRQTYPVLSHRLERQAEADLLAFRWQRYVRFHHELPLSVVNGRDLPFTQRNLVLQALSRYLDKPIFRIGFIEGFSAYTKNWDYRPLHTIAGDLGLSALDARAFNERLAEWVTELPKPLHMSPGQGNSKHDDDLAHFCSHYVNKDRLEAVLQRFDSFCIAGQPASVAYIAKRLRSLGKPFSRVSSYAPEALRKAPPFDCLLSAGPMGNFEVTVPAVACMGASGRWRTLNIDDPALSDAMLRTMDAPSNDDWFLPGALSGTGAQKSIRRMRKKILAARAEREAKRERRLAKRAEREARALRLAG